MSIAICYQCGDFVDTDEGDAYPFAYVKLSPDAPKNMEDICLCEGCQEDESFDRWLKYIVEDAA